MLRFVVLHHTDIDRPHFDLMMESSGGSSLMTWRSPSWPIEERTVVQRLADHRSIYLEFEGTIAGNRGQVRRVDSGEGVVHSDDQYQLGDTLIDRVGPDWIATKGNR